jgi:hypothetical protein
MTDDAIDLGRAVAIIESALTDAGPVRVITVRPRLTEIRCAVDVGSGRVRLFTVTVTGPEDQPAEAR